MERPTMVDALLRIRGDLMKGRIAMHLGEAHVEVLEGFIAGYQAAPGLRGRVRLPATAHVQSTSLGPELLRPWQRGRLVVTGLCGTLLSTALERSDNREGTSTRSPRPWRDGQALPVCRQPASSLGPGLVWVVPARR